MKQRFIATGFGAYFFTLFALSWWGNQSEVLIGTFLIASQVWFAAALILRRGA
ncbi:hypothetical protein [Phyllobacterium leguminum]|uniref:Uncharacterized protein n=1 Tax=Phyllobacterium leguminum TaxID=314237 RepID=A0A318T5Q4_9HYPH|nr:hypothetical protein [Phyllobacterium leguminum]PYE89614.1 hypothetical protein C7477_103122 [Phyllobacterium leguminum]